MEVAAGTTAQELLNIMGSEGLALVCGGELVDGIVTDEFTYYVTADLDGGKKKKKKKKAWATKKKIKHRVN